MADLFEAARFFTDQVSRAWGELSAVLNEYPFLWNAIILSLGLLLAASLLWIRYRRSEARKLQAFMDPFRDLDEIGTPGKRGDRTIFLGTKIQGP
jgi:hypothetical protein